MSGDENTKVVATEDEDDDDSEDHATVVLDLNKMREELAKQNDLSDAAADLEFSVGADDDQATQDSKDPTFKVIMFEYGQPLFESSLPTFPEGFEYIVAKGVKELSALLKSTDFQVVMFYYNGEPKAVNKLCGQVKAKFPKTKTIIVAKNLSPEKVAIHQASASGANEYITLPLITAKIKSTLVKVYKDNN
jgi:hypothetical protein